MKKLLLMLAALMMLCINANANTAAFHGATLPNGFSISDYDSHGEWAVKSGQTAASVEIPGVAKMEFTSAQFDANQVRWYANATMTLTPADNITLTKFYFTETNQSKEDQISDEAGNKVSSEGSPKKWLYTWTGEASEPVKFKAAAQVRFTHLVIEYTVEGGGEVMETVSTPVITPEETSLYDGDKVTISCETEGAAIYYTLDGTEPTEESTLYTAPFEIAFDASQKCTVSARAYKEGMNASLVAKMTYTHVDPYSVMVTADHDGGNGSSYTAHTVTIDGVDYEIYDIHNTGRIQMNGSKSCYFFQVTEKMKDGNTLVINSISTDYDSGTKAFTVRGANTAFTAENFKTNGVELGSVSATQNIEFEKDYKYFAIYLISSGAVYLNSITVNYREAKAMVPAPVVPDSWGDEIEGTEEGLVFPALPEAEGWTAMYSVNDGEEMEASAEGTIHYSTLDPATLHTVKVWYKHENGTTTEAKEFYHLTSAAHGGFVVSGEGAETVMEFDFGNIGEGVTVYFTLNGTDPVPAAVNAAQAPRKAAADGIYHIATVEEMDAVHAITADTPKVQLHYMDDYAGTPVLKHVAVHEATGTTSAVVTDNDISTGLESITAGEGEALYFNLQGVRVDNPANGLYIRLVNGKATKIAK